ncbi:class I SAM-dependent DNA methyltransferase [Streptomyces sp. NPDC101237]|uniref:class I SAM-dependent DNA methyltransferase n=1 Tax=Streptomyces sp. NPDC101237 TaxID=3366139 RepID=UPI003819AE32
MTDSETTDFIETTRTSYDAIAEDYSAAYPGLPERPVDMSLIDAFARLVKANGAAPVADLGSGPGHITAHLHELGVPAFGVDLSPAMVSLAREAYPALRFHRGSMTSLDLPDATLGGILALYSIIHVPDAHLPATFAGFHRALVPGGHVLLAFQKSEQPGLHLTERFGHRIDLHYHWRPAYVVSDMLVKAGLEVAATLIREPQDEEKWPRAFVLARKPG